MASDGLQRFASDNYAGICPEAWAATAEVNRSHAPANGDDLWTARASSQVLMDAIGPQVVASTMLSRFGSLHWAAFRNRTVYCASKWALEGLTKAMAVELGPRGIRVNTLCPTFIETPLTRPFLAEPTFRDFVLSKIKLGRLGRVEDLMGAIVFLAGDAAALVTGSALVVDGGWTAE